MSAMKPLLYITPLRALLFGLTLALFELLTYLASDAVMPAMPVVVGDLQASPEYIPHALNLYLLGGVLLQWLIGPLADRYGRRPLLLAGCVFFGGACLATFWAQDIGVFNLLRLLQGIGLGFVVTVSYPALNEAFSEADAVRMMALLANIALLSPLLGPLLLGNRRFVAGSAALGLVGLPLIGWIGLSPVLLIHDEGLSTMEYALWQLPVFGGLILGNLIINRIADRYPLPALVRGALWPYLAGLSLMALATWLWPTVTSVVSGMSLYALGLMHFALAAGVAGALALWPLWFVVGGRSGDGTATQ
ncbi:hypothetical protein WR25_06161 [Diploscapter pachys]|uniref:Multidrug transporter MdfA n=1 Tax=Diploscapter pachys TaxID=2018661 RepID=A0A2A2KIE7_9BILA|nr:hypothetical protein WR25_06161 [Diploscapter pachys]